MNEVAIVRLHAMMHCNMATNNAVRLAAINLHAAICIKQRAEEGEMCYNRDIALEKEHEWWQDPDVQSRRSSPCCWNSSEKFRQSAERAGFIA